MDDLERRAFRVLEHALEQSAATRREYVARECGSDPRLLEVVSRLLTTAENVASGDSAGLNEPPLLPPDLAGKTLGAFVLERAIGQGKMGTVWKAKQLNPKRIVAVKVLNRAPTSHASCERFRREVEALARVDHPGIARVLSAGIVDVEQRPLAFIAMEFVAGVTLDVFVRSANLSRTARIELVAAICDAVAGAHQRGIIHRDLKPANILVETDGRPRIIDFGLAFIMDSEAHSRLTESGLCVGTPIYMSPEQVAEKPLGPHTRSDVYSLGVILYELIVGCLPYDIKGAMPFAISRMIADGRVVRPRRVDPTIAVDLESILVRALAREIDRRYANATDLADDLRRFVIGEPVRAHPPTIWYSTRKLLQQHVGAAVGILLLLAIASTWGLREFHAREVRARQLGEMAREREVGIGLQNVLTAFMSAPASPVAAREMKFIDGLNRTSESVDEMLGGYPIVCGNIHAWIGTTYLRLDLPSDALRHLVAAYRLQGANLGTSDRETLKTLNNLAFCQRSVGDLPAAETSFREALERHRSLFGPEDTGTLLVESNYASVLREQGSFVDAERLLRHVIETRRGRDATLDANGVRTLTELGMLLVATGRAQEAEEILQSAVAQKSVDDPDWEAVRIAAISNLAAARRNVGDFEDAERMLVEAESMALDLLGPRNSLTLEIRGSLAESCRMRGDFEQAEALLRSVHEGFAERYGLDSAPSLKAGLQVASYLVNRGNTDESDWIARHFLQITDESNPNTLVAQSIVAGALMKRGSVSEALPFFAELADGNRKRFGQNSPQAIQALNNLGGAQLESGCILDALRTFEAVVHDREAAQGTCSLASLESRRVVAVVNFRIGERAVARQQLVEVESRATKCLPPDHPLIQQLAKDRAWLEAREQIDKITSAK